MTDDDELGIHEERLLHGIVSGFVLALLGIGCVIAYEIVSQHPYQVATGTGVVIGAALAIYILGYLTYDVPQHLREWLDDES